MARNNEVQIVITAKDEAAAVFASIEKNVQKTSKNVETTFKGLASNTWTTFASNAKNAFGQVASGIEGLARIAGGLFIGGAVGLGAFVKQASELQGIRASFESMTGSAEDARKVLSDLNQFSFKTAFSAQDINAAARTLLGAGLSVDDLNRRMSQLGDIAGATGANLGQLTLPISQAMSKGKLDTQDYYQILNSGAGKLGQVLREEVANRGLGNISDAMSDGKVTSDILFSAIEKSAQKGGFAFEGAIKQAQTFDGQMSNLMESVGNVGLEVLGVNKATGEVDKNGMFAKLSNAVKQATDWLTKNKDTIKQIADTVLNNAAPAIAALASAWAAMKLGQGVMTLLSMVQGFMQFTQALKTGKGVMAAFNAVTAANPLGLIVLAIAAVVAALVFLQVKFNIFGKAWEGIKQLWSGASAWFGQLFDGIGKALEGVGNWFKDVFTSIGDYFKGVWDGIFSAFNAIVQFIQQWGLTILAITFWPFSLLIGLFFMFKDQIIAVFTAIWNGAVQIFTAVWNSIVAIFSPVVNFFVSVFQGAWAGIVAIWQAVAGWFGGVWNQIVGIFNQVGGFFGNVFQSAWNAMTGIFNQVGGFFRGVWNTVTGIFGSIGNAVGSSIGGAVRGAINGALSIAQNAINGFIGMINGAAGIINHIPGVHLGRVPNISLPRLATGTNFFEGGMALVGENGPELVSMPKGSTVTTAGRTERMLQSMTSKKNEFNITVTAYTPLDMQRFVSDLGYMASQG